MQCLLLRRSVYLWTHYRWHNATRVDRLQFYFHVASSAYSALARDNLKSYLSRYRSAENGLYYTLYYTRDKRQWNLSLDILRYLKRHSASERHFLQEVVVLSMSVFTCFFWLLCLHLRSSANNNTVSSSTSSYIALVIQHGYGSSCDLAHSTGSHRSNVVLWTTKRLRSIWSSTKLQVR